MKIKKILLCLVLCILVSGCIKEETITTADKEVIHIYSDSIASSDWISKIKAQFPDVKFEVFLCRSNDMEYDISRRIEHGDTPDIIFSNDLNKDIPNIQNNLMNISGKNYVTKYMTSFLNDVHIDGKIYYLPAQVTVRGISYNYSMFQQNNWKFPQNYEEFIQSLSRFQSLKQRSAILTYGNQYASDLFYRYFMLEIGHKLEGGEWLQRFNQQKASLKDLDLNAVFDDIENLMKYEGVSGQDKQTDNNVAAYKQTLHEIGYIENSGRYINSIQANKYNEDYRMMPYYSMSHDESYLFISSKLYVGVGNQVSQDPQKEAIVDRIMEYITTDDAQRSMAKLTGGLLSPTIGVIEDKNDDFFANVQQILDEERFLSIPKFEKCNDTLNEMIEAFILGKATRQEVIEAVDKANQTDMIKAGDVVLGQVDSNLSYNETAGAVLEALKKETKADLAMIFSIGDATYNSRNNCINGKLYQGDITIRDINAIMPYRNTYSDEADIVLIQMTGNQILKLLPYDTLYHYYGIQVEYKKEGKQYFAVGLKDESGHSLDLNKIYKVAMTKDSQLKETDYVKIEKSDFISSELFQNYIADKKVIVRNEIQIDKQNIIE